jgi:heat shock protein HslJ
MLTLLPQVAPAAAAQLAGTAWRLVEFRSMDDAIGTVRPEDPAKFTMQLNSDGTVTMQLDCNRASGSWQAKPGADGVSGSFTFGRLASTRAYCPPPNLDVTVTAQAEYVRSFLLKDGRLYLSLMADGGIFAWEPLPAVSFETTPDRELESAILKAMPYYTRATIDDSGIGQGRYVYTKVDLNGDGRPEVMAYLLGSTFCGTGGCNLLLFTATPRGYKLVNNFPISRLPVIVSPKRTKGWPDLFRLESGGGARPSYVRHAFNGKRYLVKGRMKADKPPVGKSYLGGEVTFAGGIPLLPQQ